jgi:WD40 repeat protein
MSGSGRTGLFISYARKDGTALAQRLLADLTKEGLDAWLDAERIRAGSIWSQEIEREIESREVMIALLSPGSHESEICRAEQLRALDKGKRLIPVLVVKDTERPIYLYAKQYLDFSDDADYSGRLAELLVDIRSGATATLDHSYRRTRITYLTSPPRVTNYLERPEALQALRNAVFAEDHRQPIALTALAGMGGIGKTVLAKALTDDEVVQRAFPDGIIWITAGKERNGDFSMEMREVARALGDESDPHDTPLASRNRYRAAITTRSVLIVVDDVWSKADVEPLVAESPRSRILFTTRDRSIARVVAAREQWVELLDMAQSRHLLASWVNLPVAALTADAEEIIRECGRLPLAISMIGAVLRGADRAFWCDLLTSLRGADISAIRQYLPDGQDSFFRAVEISFHALPSEVQERYKELAVLPEDMPASLPMLERIWATAPDEARRLSRLLVERSLAYSEGGSIRIHDLQLDYLRAQHSDKLALGLIRGAIRISAHVLTGNPEQFTSQVVGRLLPYSETPAIGGYTKRFAACERRPWLRSLKPTLYPPGAGLVGILRHSEPVIGVAVTDDGLTAVAAAGDSIAVWDTRAQRQIRLLSTPSVSVLAIALSADGAIAVAAYDDRTIKVWDVPAGSQLQTLAGHSDEITCLVLRSDGLLAASGSKDKTIRIWDVKKGTQLRCLTGHSAPIVSVALNGTGRTGISAAQDGTMRLWDIWAGSESRVFRGDNLQFVSVRCNPDATQLTAVISKPVPEATDRRSLWLSTWDPGTGELRAELDLETDSFGCWLLSYTTSISVFTSYGRIKLFGNGGWRRYLTGHFEKVTGLAMSADGRLLLSASSDKTVKVWEAINALEGYAPEFYDAVSDAIETKSPVTGLAVGMGRQRAFSCGGAGALRLWDVDSCTEIKVDWRRQWWSSYQYRHADHVACSQSSKVVLSVYSGSLMIWKTKKKWNQMRNENRFHKDPLNNFVKLHKTFLLYPHDLIGIALSADGRTVLIASREDLFLIKPRNSPRTFFWNTFSEKFSGCRYRVSDIKNCKIEGLIGSNTGALAISSDGRIGSVASNQAVVVWDLQSGHTIYVGAISSPVTSLALNSSGGILVEALEDCTLRVFDLRAPRELHVLSGHLLPVNALAFGVDDWKVVAVSSDATVRVWDVVDGALIAEFTCDAPVLSCAYGNDYRILAGDALGKVHFLSLEHPK